MRAVIQEITPQENQSAIIVICNKIEPHYVETRLASKKYKKVSKAAKARLLKCIEKGWSIINVKFYSTQVSKKFGINYSTAKSIVQNQKKRILQGDGKASSTESFESCEEEEYL